MPNPNTDTLLSRLKNVTRQGAQRQWKALCPCHDDVQPSLSVKDDGGTLLLKCQAGCRTADVLKAVGMQWSDLFDDGRDTATRTGHDGGSRASRKVSAKVYEGLLGLLPHDRGFRPLSDASEGRGLPGHLAASIGWRWVAPTSAARAAAQLYAAWGPALYTVPGFRRTPAGPRLTHNEGLLIPVRDVDGSIQGLQIRLVYSQGGKYRWLSSQECSSGTPAHCPVVRSAGHANDPPSWPVVRITEGPLKADVATHLDPDGILTLGVAGVSRWKPVLPMLSKIPGLHTVRVAFDSDWQEKPVVAQAVREFCDTLAQTLTVECECWSPEDGKGIDDLFRAGKRPHVFTEADLREAV